MTTLVAPWAMGSIDDSSVTLNNYNYMRRRAGRNGEREMGERSLSLLSLQVTEGNYRVSHHH